MTRRWLVLADDLTGAADCAIALGRRGLAAVVIWGDIRSARSRQEPILAYDTASRGLSADAAAARQRDVLACHPGSGRLLFKKIDSTLRGQPAAEIAATLECLGSRSGPAFGVLAAAFPATGRTTRGGRILVNGRTLEETDLWRRDHTYPNADLVDALATAGVRSEKITLAAVRNGELKTILARNNVGNFGTINEFEGVGGNDSITGNGNTRIAFYNASDGVTVDLAAGTSRGTAAGDVAGVGNDSFTGVNAVRGSGFNDLIAGSSGNETLDGQGGNDTIQGRGGADTLIGGGGADRFVFNSVSDSAVASSDTISDFVHAADVIDTSAISGITSVQGLISGATQIAAHSVVWIQSGANTIVYMNNSAAAQDQTAADMRIVLTGVTASTLTSSDFFHF